MTLETWLRTLHLLGVIVWVGGMVFAHYMLRPALEVLPAPDRPRLMRAVLQRFFAAVAVAALAVLVSGWWLLARVAHAVGSLGTLPIAWWFMAVVGTAMVLIFGVIRLVWYPRFVAALGRGPGPEVGAALGRIRTWVGVNLALGVAVILTALLRPG